MASAHTPHDLRGPQRRIARLLTFSGEAFVHVLAYRIMVPLNIVFGAVILLSIFIGIPGTLLKVLTAVTWALWTPQLFEVAKGLSLAWTRGMAFGNLNEEFAHLYRKRYGRNTAIFTALPWVVLVLWAAGFVILLVVWRP